MTRRLYLVALVCVFVACGESKQPPADPRAPVPAPSVALSAADRELWAPGPEHPSAVPVLVYSGFDADGLARQLTLLDHAGYETITLDDFVRFVKGDAISLPLRPVLLTFDGGRLDTFTRSDAILRELGFDAVLFVNVGRVEEGNRDYLTYEELTGLQAGGRWDVQLQSGTGYKPIRYGSGPDDVGPFYAYRGSEEVLGGWRERVFSDITYGEKQLAHHVEGYRPLAFAPPYGNYGQAGTNDPRIPRELRARLLASFEVIFTQDRAGVASPGARNPIGRIEVTPDLAEAELRRRLAG